MEEIIELMHEKNHYLEKFYSLNKSELGRIAVGNYENLQSFYQNRDKLLELVQYIDEKMDNLNHQTHAVELMTKRDRERVLRCLERKDELAKEIIDQDLIIIGHIERAKADIIRDIGTLRQSRKAIRGYRSDNIGG